MQLIKVYSNKKSFHTVEFKLNQPNFIVAKQKNPGSNEDGKTYNGVGKSLLIKIIHFCLGASKKDYKVFCEKLEGWEFYLDFIINGNTYSVKRKTEEPEKIILNKEELTLDKFTKRMGKLCFLIPDNTAFLSFRSLLPFFLRPKKESYVDCKKTGKTGSEYQTLLYNSFLIGLDINLAEKKYRLRKEQERIRKLEKNFKEDSLLRDFFSGSRDVSLTLADLDDKIHKIEYDLKQFKVAEDYHDIQSEADVIEKNLFEINNEITMIQNNIDNIEKSLNITPSMSSSDLEAVYSEVKVIFPDSLKKNLNDIDDFYSKLISNRIRRLSEQKNHLKINLNEKLNESSILKRKLDELMNYLGEHQALDLFISLSEKVASLKSEKENLEKYQILQSEYKTKERQTEKKMIELSEITDNYLSEIESNTNAIKDYFRTLAKNFYPQNVAGLTIKTNEGENQLIFDIDPKIESDASDGINNVKIFCYDLSILIEGKNHNIDFVFHDSRLYDGIDERQKTTMFKIINDIFFSGSKQYISTVNQNQLQEIRNNLSEDEYKTLIENNTILTLTDDSDNEKLLGIKVDIGNS
jgi:uncharacterized protein YydD (DUF2326 family)